MYGGGVASVRGWGSSGGGGAVVVRRWGSSGKGVGQ